MKTRSADEFANDAIVMAAHIGEAVDLSSENFFQPDLVAVDLLRRGRGRHLCQTDMFARVAADFEVAPELRDLVRPHDWPAFRIGGRHVERSSQSILVEQCRDPEVRRMSIIPGRGYEEG